MESHITGFIGETESRLMESQQVFDATVSELSERLAILEGELEDKEPGLQEMIAARSSLAEQLEGADPLEVSLREEQATLAKAKLDEAEEDLMELLEGPDPLEVGLAKAEVASAQLDMRESIQRLEDSALRSPIVFYQLWL